MLQSLIDLLGGGSKIDYAELIKQGAIIVDVRTKGEYSGGHIKGSLNIPLDQLTANLNKLKSKDQPVLTCCASGMRSGKAKEILMRNGYANVHNAGAWQNLKPFIK